jgi:cold shock CspA family protein
VKWFNNKKGFGFIIIQSDSDNTGKEIYVHFSNIVVADTQQYKYLVDGEYVEFDLSPASAESGHEFQATSVTGPFRGTLMCQVRQQNARPVSRRSAVAPAPAPDASAEKSSSSSTEVKKGKKRTVVTDADGFTKTVRK